MGAKSYWVPPEHSLSATNLLNLKSSAQIPPYTKNFKVFKILGVCYYYPWCPLHASADNKPVDLLKHL